MILSVKYFEGKADRLFKEWDAIDDPYGLPINEFHKAVAKVNQASLICMVLNARKED